jgi:bifunctional non-homologous end joining protein LigD
MHLTQVARPFHAKGWVYEEKIDGWRMLALKEAGRVRLVSRNGRDHTNRFHAIAEALVALKAKPLTLDGEVAVFDAELVSRLEWLRHINHGDLATPPLFIVFDLLQLGEKDYRLEPLKVRRKALEKLVKGQTLILPARRLTPNGLAAWTEVLHRGYEGYVAKAPESPYVAGRTRKWLKVKQPKYREEERGFYTSPCITAHRSVVVHARGRYSGDTSI